MSGDIMSDFYVPSQMRKHNNFILWKLDVGRRIEGDINGKLFFQPFSH